MKKRIEEIEKNFIKNHDKESYYGDLWDLMENEKFKVVDVLSPDDLDVYNKLDNLVGGLEISEGVFDIACEKCDEINSCIWNSLQDENVAICYVSYHWNLGKEYFDDAESFSDYVSACIYNNDLLYMQAIAEVLELDIPENASHFLHLDGEDIEMD